MSTNNKSNNDLFSGILLFVMAIAALILANTPLDYYYTQFIDTPVSIRIADFVIDKPLLLWINDGLMVFFFLLVGLELKREFLVGQLRNRELIKLPLIGAVGGIVIPAAIYVAINWHNAIALNGWAIPAATDIAFVLGVLALLGRVPVQVKLFVLTLAILDDIAAILIIAIFYTSQISLGALAFALCCTMGLAYLNYRNVHSLSPYILLGVVMWASLLKSGVHATMAGVIVAMFIPMGQEGDSLLENLERDLHPVSSLFTLPIFAFVNSGINFSGLGLDYLLHEVPLGIALGLFLGKQIGIFSFCFIGIKCGMAKLPKNMSWFTLYGVSVLCGIGFTMSLFISSLAFQETSVILTFDERIGIMLGSLLSGLWGYFILSKSLKKT